jgi:hypothetical protein
MSNIGVGVEDDMVVMGLRETLARCMMQDKKEGIE